MRIAARVDIPPPQSICTPAQCSATAPTPSSATLPQLRTSRHCSPAQCSATAFTPPSVTLLQLRTFRCCKPSTVLSHCSHTLVCHTFAAAHIQVLQPSIPAQCSCSATVLTPSSVYTFAVIHMRTSRCCSPQPSHPHSIRSHCAAVAIAAG